jgi:hypothetical protein
MSGAYLHSPNTPSWRGAQLTHRDNFIFTLPIRLESRDSSVGMALGYGLDDRGSRVRFPAGAGNFPLHHRVQTGSGAHPASYTKCSRVSFPGGKQSGT